MKRIRTSSIKKYKSFFADKNKRLIVPYIPELLAKAKFISENTYTPETEKNIVAYWKADLPINIDSDGYNVHLTVKEDDKGNFFWDAQIKGKARRTVSATNPSVGGLQSPSADPATNPGVKGLTSELSEDGLSVTQTSKNVNNPLYQSAFAENVVNMPTIEEFNNPVKDYELLRLNESDLRKLGKEDKPVVLKKNIIEKNKRNHPEVDISEYDKILIDTLINTSEIIQVQPQRKPNYYTFINEGQSDVSVVELSENKDNYEVVNFFKVNKKRIDEYRKKAVKDGGDIIITEREPQGAARLSALLNSDTNNITPTRENVNNTLYQGQIANRVKEIFQPAFSDVEKFAETLKKAIRGELKPQTMLQVSSSTPEVYKSLGVENKALNLPQNVLRKINIGKHNVPLSVIENLPEFIANPLVVLDSKTEIGSFVSVLDATDANGDTVVAVIKPTERNYNVIPSIYGKKEIENLIKSSNVRYVNDIEKPATASIDLSSLQLRGGDSARGNNNNILQKSDIVKTAYQEYKAPKGAYMQNLDRNGIIYLFEKADASTFMHETSHFFRKELQSFDTARSREMLKKVNEWENNQFDQRYKIQKQGGGFVVTDKIGNVIYGAEKPFFDAETAREYGKNEIFARGFEQYLREGKAPSNYLKQAFRSFWNWLRHLYKAALDLNVELNDGIRSVYGDIIGGQDLDFYLSAPVDEVLQQHFAENEDRKKIYEEQIALAQAQPIKRNFTANLVRERTDGAKGRNEWWNKAMVPISTRAKRVNIKLRNKLRAYDYGLNTKLNQYYAQIKPFLDKWATMTETDAVAFDLALKNSYVEKQIEIVKKYDAYDEFVAVKNLLNSLFDQAIDVGIEMGYSSDYFPRQIEDVEGFMAAIYGSPFSSQLRRALREADPDNVMTNEERAEFFNKYLRGFNRRDLNKPLPGNTKDRSIDIVTAEMNKYYKPSMQALISYIEGMNTSIESRKFWGFKSDDINQSIGALTADLVDTGVITPEQDAEVQEILRARFKAKGVTNKWLNLQKNVSYIYTMGGLNSAITQLDDISMSLYKAGLWNTVQSVLHPNRPGLSREELGLERIGQEFVEASTSSQAVSTIFKLTGLDKIDAFGKNTLINATFNKFQKMAKNNEAELRARIEPVMEQETEQTIEDIKNGVISQNVKLLMFNELADVQPIALSEMPEWYLTSGNGRVFYMLKTFMLKRLDIFRNESFDRMRQGDVKTGMQNLFRLAILMILSGAAKDAIIDMMFGRDFDVTDTMVNNLLGLAGISKYTLYKARDEGFSGFASSFLIPPVFASSSDLLSDIYKSLFSKKGKDIKDYEIWKGIPLIGRFYYWWMGGGRTKENRKKKKKLK